MFFTLVSLTGHGKEIPQQPLHTQYRPMLFPASIPGHTEEEALDRLLVLNCLVFKLGIYSGSYFRYFIKFYGSYIVFIYTTETYTFSIILVHDSTKLAHIQNPLKIIIILNCISFPISFIYILFLFQYF